MISEPAVQEAFKLYQSSAGLMATYWGFYVTAATVVVGYVIGSSTPPQMGVRIVLAVGFAAFALSNFSTVVNKHALTFAVAQEVAQLVKERVKEQPGADESMMQRKLSHVCKGLQNLYPEGCLHATRPRTVAGLHAVADVVVLGIIFGLNRSSRK
jgi:hypothetical protein